MKRTLDILIALIIMVGIVVIIDIVASRPIFEQIGLGRVSQFSGPHAGMDDCTGQ